jgi:hypothetical protein
LIPLLVEHNLGGWVWKLELDWTWEFNTEGAEEEHRVHGEKKEKEHRSFDATQGKQECLCHRDGEDGER